MSRNRRIFSCNGYMHLIIRGVGRQILFEDQEDYQFFLSILKRFTLEAGIAVMAYCLMENHVHLLVFDPEGNSSVMMKKLEISYAHHFNKKYERVGHLFQDRFLNENIDTPGILLIVFRYILNNPVKAGICPASAYRWSSYSSYDDEESFVDTSILHELIGNIGSLDTFLGETENGIFRKRVPRFRDDDWAREIISMNFGIGSGSLIKSFGRKERDEAVRKLKMEGLTIRQIERLTGVSRSVIQRA